MRGTQPFIYLASQSPRRSQLLTQIGVPHELLLAGPEEDAESLEAILPGEAPKTYVQRVTRLKLEAAMQRLRARGLPPAPVLCADTTVALGRTIYGKPADAAEARAMLAALSGHKHRVMTAVAVGQGGQRLYACCVSDVEFCAMSAEEIGKYVDSGEPMGKAGAYAVQGQAARFISRISGSYTGIMGLPLFETSALLRTAGVLACAACDNLPHAIATRHTD
jgi:septum formation protein